MCTPRTTQHTITSDATQSHLITQGMLLRAVIFLRMHQPRLGLGQRLRQGLRCFHSSVRVTRRRCGSLHLLLLQHQTVQLDVWQLVHWKFHQLVRL